MFKKKPNIKPLSPIRSSDRRKVADQIISTFNIELPISDDGKLDQTDQNSPNCTLGELRNSLLPEGSQSARFTTTSGPNLDQVTGTLYIGAYPGQEQRVLWVKIDDTLIPSVYTLWQHPRLLPLLHTPNLVLQKLKGGADLMTPGLVRGPPFPPKAVKNSTVAIASLEKPSVPQFVGVCLIDVASLQQVQGVKGHAVRGYHWDGDEIWAWSQGGKSGGSAPDMIEGWDLADEEDKDKELINGAENLSLGDDESESAENGVPLNDEAPEHVSESHSKSAGVLSYTQTAEKISLPTKEIDDIFWQAFLYGAHEQCQNHKDSAKHGLNFPVPQSLIISSLVLPYLPELSPSQAGDLQIKKTSWKNAKKFIKALEKQHILKSKDRDGGETFVTDIHFENMAIANFVPYKLSKKEIPATETAGENSGKGALGESKFNDDSIGQKLSTLHLLKPKDQLSPIFESSTSNVKRFYLPSELRPILTAYIDSEDLTSSTNKRLVTLNPTLANAVFDAPTSLDRDILAKGSVPRDALLDRIVEKCTPHWAILRNDETRDSVKPKSGALPKIQLTYETRSGNKTVTKISGLEIYFINPAALADELQKACASSTSVGQLMGSSPRNPVMEVVVQGPQKDAVFRALEKRGVQRKWVDVVNKTKGGKK